ncbi:ABC transporter transmembrane domain-containing protein [Aureimonas phyllosphaerae]|uniref:Putative ABC transport system ATP-binding protein n=1 Tax=Aureimonas phyllosphaerae TaxID=1166078 RepID=A0A7W6FSL6_9HYPH|nr:ABC transporter transmembrane domain-containing protein [Aureimonas phyllosphaerae]MBB3934113.1 putative ABC transport system ATP-binding protein [Aureimonas phyllosphaerae]MBB3958671.1 putative ABC transport system ATP-binding protein [Aureimonas phyllosphaerae]SFF17727.1 putative ABC transport system ATP-binding protein [Aureimonas phyllosphaerae]
MATSLYRYIWHHTRREQIWMLVVVVVSVIPFFLSLNLPKLIINGPIQGEGFEGAGATVDYFRLTIPLPGFLGGSDHLVLLDGTPFERMEALFVLSSLFLLFVVVNGAFKFYLNTYKGRLGERMLRRMRYEMVDRVLRFPIRQFRRIRPAEVASMIKDELEPIGGFIGDAFVQPLYLSSQILTAMIFIFLQSWTLGAVAFAVTAFQAILIPRMRRRLLILGRERQLTARRLAGSVGEIIESMPTIRTNDTSNIVRARISEQLGRIFLIRFDIYQWKFFVKFLNNFLSQATPFIFYMFGGYFAIRGQIDIGELVAVIAAYRELPAPLKDLIDWDLMRLDVDVKYDQVAQQFDIDGLLDPATQAPIAASSERLEGGFQLIEATIRDDTGAALVSGVSLDLPLHQRLAAVGPLGDGAEVVAEALVGLAPLASGLINLSGRPLGAWPESVTGRRLAYAEPASYYPRSNLREALLYPLMHHPLHDARPATTRSESRMRTEALQSGNSLLDPNDDWIDRSALSPEPDEEIARIEQILVAVELRRDLTRFGLSSRVPEWLTAKAGPRIVLARRHLAARLREEKLDSMVERFDPGAFLDHATLMENLVFGAARQDEIAATRLLIRSDARRVLERLGLDRTLVEMGLKIAMTLVELFGEIGADDPMLRRMDIISPDEIDFYRQIVVRLGSSGRTAESDEDRGALIRLALSYVEPRYRLGLVDDTLRARVIEARTLFHETASQMVREGVEFHEPDRFNPAATLKDNIVFGRVANATPKTSARIDELLDASIDAYDLGPVVLRTALEYDLGAGAKRLSLGQQQKVTLARAMLKAPDYLVANRCLSALDADTQARILRSVLQLARDAGRPFGMYWVPSAPIENELFDRIVRFERGQLTSDSLADRSELVLSSSPGPQ